MDEDEFPVVRRQTVINDNVNPFTKVPETKVKDATIPIAPALVRWYNLLHEWEGGREGGREGRREEEGNEEKRERDEE